MFKDQLVSTNCWKNWAVVRRADASNTRGPRFDSSHLQMYDINYQMYWKEMNKKEAQLKNVKETKWMQNVSRMCLFEIICFSKISMWLSGDLKIRSDSLLAFPRNREVENRRKPWEHFCLQFFVCHFLFSQFLFTFLFTILSFVFVYNEKTIQRLAY